MPTPRETILAALHVWLSALPVTVLRGEVLPERGPAESLLILRDGEPGEPEVTLSPLRYHYQHRAEMVVQGAARDTAFDTLIASVGTVLAADRTLGGFCDWVEADLQLLEVMLIFTRRRICLPIQRRSCANPVWCWRTCEMPRRSTGGSPIWFWKHQSLCHSV